MGWTKLQIWELVTTVDHCFVVDSVTTFLSFSLQRHFPSPTRSQRSAPFTFQIFLCLCKSIALPLPLLLLHLSCRRINSLQLTSLTPTHLLCPSRIQQDSFLDRVLSQLGTLGSFLDSSFQRALLHFTGQVLSMKILLGIYS